MRYDTKRKRLKFEKIRKETKELIYPGLKCTTTLGRGYSLTLYASILPILLDEPPAALLPLSMEDHSRIRVGSGTPARASLADPPTVGCNMQLPSADMQLRSASWDSWNAAGIQRHSAANQRNPAVICCTALNMATAFWRRYYGEEWGRKRRRRR